MYPDFKNSILIFPQAGYYFSGDTVSSGTKVATIGGTPINMRAMTIDQQQYYTAGMQDSTRYMGITFGGASATSKTLTKNIGLDKVFEAGSIIGKRIILPKITYLYASSATNITKCQIAYTINLLHTSGKMETIVNQTNSYTSNVATNGSAGGINGSMYGNWTPDYDNLSTDTILRRLGKATTVSETLLIEGSGKETQAGDMLVVQLSQATTCSSSASVGVVFGYAYSLDNTQRAQPIQISID